MRTSSTFCAGRRLASTLPMPASRAMISALTLLSPVSMTVCSTPSSRASSSSLGLPARSWSVKTTTPAGLPSMATKVAIRPSAAARARGIPPALLSNAREILASQNCCNPTTMCSPPRSASTPCPGVSLKFVGMPSDPNLLIPSSASALATGCEDSCSTLAAFRSISLSFTVQRDDAFHDGGAIRQRSRLVEEDDPAPPDLLDCRAVLHDDALLRSPVHPADDGERRRKYQRAGRRDHKDGEDRRDFVGDQPS